MAKLFYDDEFDALAQTISNSEKSSKQCAAFLFPHLKPESQYARLCGGAVVTLRERVRALCDGLERGAWLTFADVRERLPDVPYTSVASTLSKMARDEQLKQRGTHGSYSYRSGPKPVLRKATGRTPRVRTGFMYLARLRETDPEAYAKEIAMDRERT